MILTESSGKLKKYFQWKLNKKISTKKNDKNLFTISEKKNYTHFHVFFDNFRKFICYRSYNPDEYKNQFIGQFTDQTLCTT